MFSHRKQPRWHLDSAGPRHGKHLPPSPLFFLSLMRYLFKSVSSRLLRGVAEGSSVLLSIKFVDSLSGESPQGKTMRDMRARNIYKGRPFNGQEDNFQAINTPSLSSNKHKASSSQAQQSSHQYLSIFYHLHYALQRRSCQRLTGDDFCLGAS